MFDEITHSDHTAARKYMNPAKTINPVSANPNKKQQIMNANENPWITARNAINRRRSRLLLSSLSGCGVPALFGMYAETIGPASAAKETTAAQMAFIVSCSCAVSCIVYAFLPNVKGETRAGERAVSPFE